MKYIIGIDNGLSGAIVVLKENRELTIYDTPVIEEKRKSKGKRQRYDEQSLIAILRKYTKKSILPISQQAESIVEESDYVISFLELAHALPSQAGGSPSGNFMTGFGSGIYKATLAIYQIPYEEISAKIWQRAMLEGVHGQDLKKKSVDVARRLFVSQQQEFLGPRGGLRDGRSDATLIAEYGLRKITGELKATTTVTNTDENPDTE